MTYIKIFLIAYVLSTISVLPNTDNQHKKTTRKRPQEIVIPRETKQELQELNNERIELLKKAEERNEKKLQSHKKYYKPKKPKKIHGARKTMRRINKQIAERKAKKLKREKELRDAFLKYTNKDRSTESQKTDQEWLDNEKIFENQKSQDDVRYHSVIHESDYE